MDSRKKVIIGLAILSLTIGGILLPLILRPPMSRTMDFSILYEFAMDGFVYDVSLMVPRLHRLHVLNRKLKSRKGTRS